MRRVLHVITDTHTGAGPANSLLTLLDYLSAGYQSFVAVREEGGLSAELAKRGIRYMVLNIPRPSKLNLPVFFVQVAVAVIRLCVFIIKNRVDIVHVHQTQSVWGVAAGRLTGRPVIFHAREIFGSSLYRRLLLFFSDRVIAISGFVADRLVNGDNDPVRKKISIIYNGVDLARFNTGCIDSSKARQEHGIPPGRPFVLMVGKLVRIKGHIDFIRAGAIIKKTFPGAVFGIAGGEHPGHEEYASEVRQCVRDAGFNGSFHFFGFQKDVENIISAADIVVFPSTWQEPLGRVAIEAMALCKPVIATNTGGIPEAVVDGQTGYLVPAGDPEGIAGAAIKLLESPELCRQFGETGAKRAQNLFGAPQYAAGVERVYEGV